METTTNTTDRRVINIVYCERCGEPIYVYDDYETSQETFSFDGENNTFYCEECYNEEATEREQAIEADYVDYFERKRSIQDVLESLDVDYEYHLASTGSMYWSCEVSVYNEDEDLLGTKYFKVRLADHSQCYDADYNVATSDNNQDGSSLESFREQLEADIEDFRNSQLNK